MHKRDHLFSLLQIHIAVFLFGTSSLFAKIINLEQTSIAFTRTVLAAGTITIVLLIKKQQRKAIAIRSTQDFFMLCIQGILLSIHLVCFFKAIEHSTVAIGVLSFSIFPTFIVFLEPLILKAKIDYRNVLVSMLALLGIMIILPDIQSSNQISMGMLYGFIAALSYSITIILNRIYVQNYSSTIVSFYMYCVASIVLLPFIPLQIFNIPFIEIIYILILGIFLTGVAMLLLIRGMKNISAYTTGIISCLEPFYGILLAAFLLKEIPSTTVAMGGALIIGAAIYVSAQTKN